MSEEPWIPPSPIDSDAEQAKQPPNSLATREPAGLPALPAAPWLGLGLIWLCLCLPIAAIVFLGGPAWLAIAGVEILADFDVPIEVWSSAEPWILVSLSSIVIFRRASFSHRREPGGYWWLWPWLGFGALTVVTSALLLVMESSARTELNPVFHYWPLAIFVGWSSLTLAWSCGRAVSVFLAPLERRALRSGPLRGALTAGGPMAVVGVLSVVGVASAYEVLEDELDGVQALVSSSLPEARALTAGGGGSGSGSSGASGSRAAAPRVWQFDECIREIYAGPNSLFDRAVEILESHGYVKADAKDFAADASVSVCQKPRELRDLGSYYLRSAKNRAKSVHRRRSRLEVCQPPGWDDVGIPGGENPDDCAFEQLCNLPIREQQVVKLRLEGYTGKEIARELGLTQSAATKRYQRAMGKLSDMVERECAP